MYVRKSSLPCGVFFVPFWQEELLLCHVSVLVARWAGKHQSDRDFPFIFRPSRSLTNPLL